MRLPDREDRPGHGVRARRMDAGPFQRVYLDPPTGRVLDTATGRDFLGRLHAFHESLMLRDYNGREIVGVVGIAMLISSLSGIYLWWPAGGLRRKAFGFRRGFALHRNLHYTFGIWGAVVLAMLSFTGIFLGFSDAGRAVVAAFTHGVAVTARTAGHRQCGAADRTRRRGDHRASAAILKRW